MHRGDTAFIEIIKMSQDPQHELWDRRPFVVEYNRNLPYSYTKFKKDHEPQIHLRRLYDLVHEYLHIWFGTVDFDFFTNEQLANLSELLEVVFVNTHGSEVFFLLE